MSPLTIGRIKKTSDCAGVFVLLPGGRPRRFASGSGAGVSAVGAGAGDSFPTSDSYSAPNFLRLSEEPDEGPEPEADFRVSVVVFVGFFTRRLRHLC